MALNVMRNHFLTLLKKSQLSSGPFLIDTMGYELGGSCRVGIIEVPIISHLIFPVISYSFIVVVVFLFSSLSSIQLNMSLLCCMPLPHNYIHTQLLSIAWM